MEAALFDQLDRLGGERAVVGTARVNGRLIMIHASDFTVLGGSIGAQHLVKFAGPLEMAAQ